MKLIFLINHELKRALLSPGIWALAALFTLLMGTIYFFLVEHLCRESSETSLAAQFFGSFWIPTLFVVPLITMRSIAEDKRSGLLEAQLSTALAPAVLVIAKFIAAYILYIALWSITLLFPIILGVCGHFSGPIKEILLDSGQYGGFEFIALSGFAYVALGIFTSSLCRSQLSAAMASFTVFFLTLVGGQVLMNWPGIKMKALNVDTPWIDYLRTFRYLEDACHGIVDSRPLVLFVSLGIVLLALSSWMLEWKLGSKD